MKKLVVMLSILLMATMAIACKKQEEAPAPVEQTEAVDTAADQVVTEEAAPMAEEAPAAEAAPATEEAPATQAN